MPHSLENEQAFPHKKKKKESTVIPPIACIHGINSSITNYK